MSITDKEALFYRLAGHGIRLRRNERRLAALADRYKGRRIFVIGNGPSLNQVDIGKLKGEITIGCNGLFLLFEETGFRPTFYTVEDRLVAEDRCGIINSLDGMTKIFPSDLAHLLLPDEATIYVNFLRNYEGFPLLTENFLWRVFWGGTVTMMNIQLAYFLGAREVYLVGVDHDYAQPFPDDAMAWPVITSNNQDINHFHPDYFGPGYRYHDPQVDRMELAYRKARGFFESRGRTIFNATVGGRLEVFPRVDFEALF